nr:FecR family protein [uncultured Arsenicibacter sp.]
MPVEQNYETYSAADFLTDDAFVMHQLSPARASTQFWEGWLRQYPHRHPVYQQAVELVEAVRLGLDTYAQTDLPEETIRRLLLRIQETNTRSAVRERRIGWLRWAAAASVVLALGGGYWWKSATDHSTPYDRQVTALNGTPSETTNASHTVQAIRLPDNSEVLLAPDSRLTYPADFGHKNRTVYLSGEATFSVTKDNSKPFFVHADDVVTRVIGTRFTVRAFFREKQVKVQVQSGQVSVYRNRSASSLDQPKGVMLLPNQQVVFNNETAQFDKRLVDTPAIVVNPYVRRKTPLFVYNDTPISQVLRDIKEAYGIDIHYNKEALENCQLNSTMTNETFKQKLTIVCATIGATYEIIDGQVVINGGDCR